LQNQQIFAKIIKIYLLFDKSVCLILLYKNGLRAYL